MEKYNECLNFQHMRVFLVAFLLLISNLISFWSEKSLLFSSVKLLRYIYLKDQIVIMFQVISMYISLFSDFSHLGHVQSSNHPIPCEQQFLLLAEI